MMCACVMPAFSSRSGRPGPALRRQGGKERFFAAAAHNLKRPSPAARQRDARLRVATLATARYYPQLSRYRHTHDSHHRATQPPPRTALSVADSPHQVSSSSAHLSSRLNHAAEPPKGRHQRAYIHILWATYPTPLGRSQAAGWRVARAHPKRHVSPSIKSLTRQLHTHSRSPSRRRSSSRSTARSPPRRTSSPTSSRCVLLSSPRFVRGASMHSTGSPLSVPFAPYGAQTLTQ